MKLLYSGTAFIEPMFPNMPHNVLSVSTAIIADFPRKHRTRIVLKINGEGHSMWSKYPHTRHALHDDQQKAHDIFGVDDW